jgi:hypothetical protein
VVIRDIRGGDYNEDVYRSRNAGKRKKNGKAVASLI